jgi:hypothetical protein
MIKLCEESVGCTQMAASSASLTPAGWRSGVATVGDTVTVPGGVGNVLVVVAVVDVVEVVVLVVGPTGGGTQPTVSGTTPPTRTPSSVLIVIPISVC